MMSDAQPDPDMPCGCCDAGIYAYAAAMTPLACSIAAAPDDKRDGMVPRCKRHDRACVGVTHFVDAVRLGGWPPT